MRSELDYSKDPFSILHQCLLYCHMNGPDEEELWEQWAPIVSAELNVRRNHAQNSAKDEYMGGLQMCMRGEKHSGNLTPVVACLCFTAWAREFEEQLEEKKEPGDLPRSTKFAMPTHKDFASLHQDGMHCSDFADHFVRAVVGAQKFDKMAVSMPCHRL